MKLYFYLIAITFIFSVSLTGCVSYPDAHQRTYSAENLASKNGWVKFDTPADPFIIGAFGPSSPTDLHNIKSLHVYIEGDGLAWISRQTPSSNPTPIHPTALQLALLDPMPSVYLARPCQYSVTPACDNNKWWMGARFAPEVVASMNSALDQIKIRFGATQLTLIGYSGGGAIATILAAQRHDVSALVTVAGNLDIQTWTDYHHASPLADSLNPVDYVGMLTNIPQTHFVGSKDKIVPPLVATAFANKFPASKKPRIVTIENYTHQCCWTEKWPTLIGQAIQKTQSQ